MMRLFSSLLLAYLLLIVVGLLLVIPADAVQGPLRRRGTSPGFYESRPDDRKCPSPYCGGVFVRPIDGSLMTCPGATHTTVECYVGALRYSQDSPPSQVALLPSIVYGRIVPGNYPSAPDIYDFVVQDGTTAAQSEQIVIDYSVQRDYRLCVSPLCGGYWLQALKTTQTLCSDGSVADTCYVANLNMTGLPEIVDGSSVQGYYIENPDYQAYFPELRDLFVLKVYKKASEPATP
jgi:hypothetical protein